MPQDPVSSAVTAVIAATYRSVQEVHIDFLLEEEFIANATFVRQFLERCHPNSMFRGIEVCQVTRSHLCKFGEIDLRVELSAEDAEGAPRRLVLLIENKIGASFQPEQAERYQRAAQLEAGQGITAATVLVAPSRYIAKGHGFQHALKYEEISDWFCPNDLVRRKAKSDVLQAAITKSATQGVQNPDDAMTAFRAAYYNHVQEFNVRQGTDFDMRAPAVTYDGDTWFQLKSKSLPDWMRFRHMAPTGYVEISFRNIDVGKAEAILRPYLPNGFTLTSTGKYHQHATIRRPVPRITGFNSYEEAHHMVEAALGHMETLLRVTVENRAQLEAGLVPLLPTKKGMPHSITPPVGMAAMDRSDANAGKRSTDGLQKADLSHDDMGSGYIDEATDLLATIEGNAAVEAADKNAALNLAADAAKAT